MESIVMMFVFGACGVVIGLLIFYQLIKLAVRNGILEADEILSEVNESNITTEQVTRQCPECNQTYHIDYPKCPHCGANNKIKMESIEK